MACDGDRVIGFYSLAASAVQRSRMSSRVGRNMPDPVPVILLGQLAVDERTKAFYGRFGFRAFSDCEPLMLLLRMSELDALLAM